MVAHLIALAIKDDGQDLLAALRQVLPQLKGAYALAVIDRQSPDELVVARQGSPLVLGIGLGENFAGSDTLALQSVTDTFIYLEEGDVAQLTADSYAIFNADSDPVDRSQNRLALRPEGEGLGRYDHYMRKEIF